MQGRVKRKMSIYSGFLELDKKDYEVEFQQMRQVGIKKDKNNVYFEFPSLFRIFSEFVSINAMTPDFEVIEKPLQNTDEIKVGFSSGDGENFGTLYGHYMINGKDNAILSFNATNLQKFRESTKNESEYDRTTQYYINYAKPRSYDYH